MKTPTQDKTSRINVRLGSLRQSWYVPQLDGKDLPVTTFDEERAWEIARAALKLAKGGEE